MHLLLLFAVATTVIGCQSDRHLSRLDSEAQRIIADQRQRSLGPAGSLASNSAPGSPEVVATDAVYSENPTTYDPADEALDVTPLPPRSRVPYPTILDDGREQDTLRLDLPQILAYAIENAPEYRRRKEDLFLSTLSLIVERHEWGPRFFSNVSGVLSGTPENGDVDTATQLIGSLGVTQRLPYGGSVSATALVDYVAYLQQSSINTDPEETQSTQLQFSLDLPLLRGAGKTAQTVEDRIQAERDLIYAVREFERFRRSFFVSLATTYFDLIRRQRQLANQELQLRNFEDLGELYIALAEAGREPYFQADRAEQRSLRSRRFLLRAQESYVQQLDSLKLQIGIDTNRSVEIVPMQIEVPELLLDTDQSVQTALTQRLDLQTVGDSVDDSRRGVLIAKNRLLPDLDLAANLNIPTDAEKRRGGFDLDAGSGNWDASLTFGVPLDREIEYADYRAALIQLERQQRQYQLNRDSIALEVRRAVRGIEQAAYLVQLQNRAVEINESRAQQIEINQRELGPREVIDVQEDLLDARNDRDEAISNLRISILQYLLATGQMRVGADGRWLPPAKLLPVIEQARAERGTTPPPGRAQDLDRIQDLVDPDETQ